VYVFDENRARWDEYFVTTDGFLSKMPIRVRALKMQHKPATEFRCARNGASPLAGVITIRNAKHAGKVWIGFSDVEWTDAVFVAHQDMLDIRMPGQLIVNIENHTAGITEDVLHSLPLQTFQQYLGPIPLHCTLSFWRCCARICSIRSRPASFNFCNRLRSMVSAAVR